MTNFNRQIANLLELILLSSLFSACTLGSRLPCPEAGDEIATPKPGEEYVTITIQNNMCRLFTQKVVLDVMWKN
jgi:hypothetical protein